MSARHAWLAWTAGGAALPHRLDLDTGPWQRGLDAQQRRWYPGADAPQVASAFVLQYLLQVPAHTAAAAAASGPWRAVVDELTFSLGANLVPDVVRLTVLVPDDAPLASRLDRAERDYRAVAEPVAVQYDSLVRLGPHTRAGMVDDMWVEARRAAEATAGLISAGIPARTSCCLIYALPGCVECAGCPRLRGAPIGS